MSISPVDTQAQTTQTSDQTQYQSNISDEMARKHEEARAAQAAEKNPFGERSFFKASVHETINERTEDMAQRQINGETGNGAVISSII